ncbi:MAG TPA: 50S ribosomal protein L5 [Candidatus Peribacteria bacterium]|nr:50S ribosomal protein L5 [Candidatus Peribacteria bacterium]
MATAKTFVPLQQRLKTDIAKSLMAELGIKNVNALPKITKVVLNVGLSQKKYSAKDIQAFIADQIAIIACQRPSIRRSRMSISNFNIRENMIVGMSVTLRGKNMYNFLDRLIGYALPRIRDFRGLNPKLDGRGNFALGITDQSIFPELPAPEANKIFGMQIQITTNAGDDKKGMALLKLIGLPFRKPVRNAAAVEKAK